MKKSNITLPTDSELVKKFNAGDQRAFTPIVKRYQGFLLNAICRKTYDMEEAMDIIQDTFVKAAKALDRYDDSKAMLSTWLYKIAMNTFLDYRRRKVSPIKFFDENDECWNSLQHAHPSPEAKFLGPYKEYDLHLLISKLPPHLAEVMALRTFKDLKYSEIAELKNMPEGTLKGYLYQSVIKLRSIVQEVYGVEIESVAA